MSNIRGLGRGLSALIDDSSDDEEVVTVSSAPANLEIKQIEPDPEQPRKKFDEAKLKELSDSIKENGVIQPIIVSQVVGDKYRIIAGERRWRASKMAGLDSIPAIIKDISKREILQFAIIENIQRDDLNPIEECDAYQKLIEEFNYTQEQLATSIGKSRSHIANLLRLRHLPEEVKEMVADGRISLGHAKILVGCENVIEIVRQVLEQSLNVRETEKLIKRQEAGSKPISVKKPAKINDLGEEDSDMAALRESIERTLGMRVTISYNDNGGSLKIDFNNLQELDRIVQKLCTSN